MRYLKKIASAIVVLGFAYVAIYAYLWLGMKSVGINESSDDYDDSLKHGYLVGVSSPVRISNNKNCTINTRQIWVERSHVLEPLTWRLLPKYSAGKIYYYHIPVDFASCASKGGLFPLEGNFLDGTTATAYAQGRGRFLSTFSREINFIHHLNCISLMLRVNQY